MRRFALTAMACAAATGCQLDELLWPTPPCPKMVVYDTVGWVRFLNEDRTVRDSLPMTANVREVCNPNRLFKER